MRVAVSLRTYGIVQRGAERTVGLVVEGLRRKGHKVKLFSEGVGKDIVTIRYSEPWRKFLRIYSRLDNNPFSNALYVKFGIGIQSSYLKNFLFLKELYKKLIQEDVPYDIIWQNSGVILGKWLTGRFKKIKKIPVVVTDHGGQSSALVIIRNKPDAIVFHTKFARDRYTKKIKGIRTEVIPTGVDIDAFLNSEPSNDLDNYERPIVLSTSALIKAKNIDLLIQAMSKIPKGTLVICGTGELKDELIDMGKRLLGSRFIYAGVLPYKTLISYYLACDVFCLTGHEYFSASMLEAMAANKPIVTWDDPTPKEVIRDAGILLDLSNIEKFSEAILEAYNTDFGDKPREYAKEYSIEKTISKYEKLFIELIE